MDYEALNDEMNTILNDMGKEEPDSEKYAAYVKRLGELQLMAIKGKELELAEAKQNEETTLKRRELLAQEEEIHQKSKCSKREARTEIGKTILGGIFTGAAILLTQTVEMNDIIRTKGWVFVKGLIPHVR